MGEILIAVVVFFVGTLVSASCLWLGMKLTAVGGTFPAMLVIAALASIAGFVPAVGWVLSFVVTLVLICKWTDAEFWPDAVLMVVVAGVISMGARVLLVGLLFSLAGA